MKTVRIAVAGAGLIGRRHIEELIKNTGCELSAIVDPGAPAQALARDTGVTLYASLAELFARDRPDGVILATPNDLHAEQALQCIDARLPTLVEKPIAHTVQDAVRVVKAAARAQVALLVGHHRCHGAIISKALELVQSGILGRLVVVSGSALFYKPDDYFAQAPWRSRSGGGPILINMIHEIGNLRALVGEVLEVQAYTSNAIRQFEVEDTAVINLRFVNGALGTFTLSDTAASARSWEQTAGENTSYAHYPDEDCYVLAGDQGSLAVPSMRMKLYDDVAQRSWWRAFRSDTASFERDVDPLTRQIEHFAEVVRGRAEPLVSAQDGLQNLRITQAIAEAAKTGCSIRIQQD
jgi:predicted dehydrogenase